MRFHSLLGAARRERAGLSALTSRQLRCLVGTAPIPSPGGLLLRRIVGGLQPEVAWFCSIHAG